MTRTRLIFLIVLLSVASCLLLLLPGWFKDPRELVQGEWQEIKKTGYVEVTDCTARWQGGNYKATLRYSRVQTDDEPYTVEIIFKEQKGLAGITFEDDDHALVNFYIMDKLPPEAREFIRQKNKVRNRPEDEVCMRFRRVNPQK